MTTALATVSAKHREALEVLRGSASQHVYSPGTSIFQQGENPESIYIIDSGLVKVVWMSCKGGQCITALRTSGWVLGIPAAILKAPRSVSAVALTRCSLSVLPCRQFLAVMKTNEAVSWHAHEQQSREINGFIEEQLALRTAPLRKRFAHLLFFLLKDEGLDPVNGPLRLELPLQRQELAQYLCVSPEHFCRIAKQMEHDGEIAFDHHSITIFNPERLFGQVQ